MSLCEILIAATNPLLSTFSILDYLLFTDLITCMLGIDGDSEEMILFDLLSSNDEDETLYSSVEDSSSLVYLLRIYCSFYLTG